MRSHPGGTNHPRVRSEQYEIRVQGELGPSVATSFPGFEAEAQAGETILRGSVCLQAHLHAVLDQTEALGLELIEIRRLDDKDDEADTP